MQIAFPGGVPISLDSDERVGDFLLCDAVFVDLEGHYTTLLISIQDVD